MFGNMMANMLIKPFQSPVFDSPESYGLDYEDVAFKSPDGVILSGWLIKGSKDKVIIQSHFGVQCCRSGYTQEGKGMMKAYKSDINFLRQAKYLNEAGYTVLMYDFRGHGKSEAGPSHWITWGLEESKDVIGAVDFISNHPEYKNAGIGLFSICMGQGASTNAFGTEDGLKKYKNLKAMVSVQPLDYPTFIKAMGLPGFIEKSTNKAIQKKTGIDFTENTFMGGVKDITVPTLVIQNVNDSFLNEDFVNKYYEDLNVKKEMLWINIPKMKNNNYNRLAAYDWIGTNSEKILEWFWNHM